MNFDTYSQWNIYGDLLFNCIIKIFQIGYSVEPYAMAGELGVEPAAITQIFKLLESLKLLEEDKNDFHFYLQYDDLKSAMADMEDTDFVEYLNYKYDKYLETVEYLKEQFDPSETDENANEIVQESESSNSYDDDNELQSLKEDAERELDRAKNLTKELEKQKKLKEENSEEEVFTSSRIAGQEFFAEKIVINASTITWSKRHLLSKKEVSFKLEKISSVSISSGILYVDIEIKSNNGRIQATNFTKSDAREIKRLIEDRM